MPCLHTLLPPRRLEPFYAKSSYIAEFWNSLSNLPFIILGVSRLVLDNEYEDSASLILYCLLIGCGTCSFIHHATPCKWTIVIDWLPISVTLGYLVYIHIWSCLAYTTWVKLVMAFSLLIADHHTHFMGIWGHAVWHVLAAYALDSVFQDFMYSQN